MKKNLQNRILERSVLLTILSTKINCSRWTVTRSKKPRSLNQFEHSSTDLRPGLQMSSIVLCHGLVLRSHRVVEIQIKASPAIKKKTGDEP